MIVDESSRSRVAISELRDEMKAAIRKIAGYPSGEHEAILILQNAVTKAEFHLSRLPKEDGTTNSPVG